MDNGNEDSMMKMLKRLKDLSPDDATQNIDMSQFVQPEEMQRNLAQADETDDIARRIQQRITAKQMAGSEADAAKDFARKYADKMKVPAGMDLGDIPDETARLGMKVPAEIRRSALSKIAGSLGRGALKAAGPIAGIVGALNPEELGGDEIIENPDIPLEIRAMAARAGEAQMREEGAEEQEFLELDKARRARAQALMERLRGESIE